FCTREWRYASTPRKSNAMLAALRMVAAHANNTRLERPATPPVERAAIGMDGKVTRRARSSTHYPPEHRRTVDSGDHVVGTPDASRCHDAADPRIARRGRRRHALYAVAGHSR